jgi:acyl-CoA thioester hydrolase
MQPLMQPGTPQQMEGGWLRWPGVLCHVEPGWIDGNRHLNMGYFLVAFDLQTDRLWAELRLGAPFRARGLTTFAVESWLDYRREMREGDPIGCDCRVLRHDAKRLLVESRMFHHAEGWESSSNESLYLCVDVATRRVSAWPEDMLARFATLETGAEGRRLTLARRA